MNELKSYFIMFLFLALGLGSALIAQSQTISRNANEDIVVTYKDGSWRYFMSSDSVLLVQEYQSFLEKERKAALPEPIIEKEKEKVAPIQTPTVSQKTVEIQPDVINIQVDSAAQAQNEQAKLQLLERRLTLTERIRRKESGYIQLTDKDVRKITEELEELNAALGRIEADQAEAFEKANPYEGYRRSDYAFDVNVKTEVRSTCRVKVEMDEVTNQKKAQVEAAYFFHATPDEMRPSLKSTHYMDAFSSVKQTNGITQLLLSFDVNSKNAKDEFGVLEKGAKLIIKFIGGNKLTLLNTVRDAGRVALNEDKCAYSGRYVLDSKTIRDLNKNDIDIIKISWSTGDEIYDIYMVDLIKQQLTCLFEAL